MALAILEKFACSHYSSAVFPSRPSIHLRSSIVAELLPRDILTAWATAILSVTAMNKLTHV